MRSSSWLQDLEEKALASKSDPSHDSSPHREWTRKASSWSFFPLSLSLATVGVQFTKSRRGSRALGIVAKIVCCFDCIC